MCFISKAKPILFLLSILYFLNTEAQNNTPFNLQFNNWKIINPASTGLNNEQRFNTNYKAVSTTLDQHPSYVLLSYENQLNQIKSGIGITFENQQAGITTYTFSTFLYNYQIQFNDQKLSIGTGIGLFKEVIDYNSLSPVDPVDPSFFTGSTQQNILELDFGVSFQKNHLETGIALRNITESTFQETGVANIRTITFYSRYAFEFSQIKLTPSFLLLSNSNYTNLHLNSILTIRELFLFGGSLRHRNEETFFDVTTGISWQNKIRIMAIVYSSETQYADNNFELSLGVTLKND